MAVLPVVLERADAADARSEDAPAEAGTVDEAVTAQTPGEPALASNEPSVPVTNSGVDAGDATSPPEANPYARGDSSDDSDDDDDLW